MTGPSRMIAVLVALAITVAASAGIEHLSASTTAEVGRTRVIAFNAVAPDTVRRPEASVLDGDILRIERAPEILAGHTVGYMRVRGMAEGRTTVFVGGQALAVDVVAPRGAAAFAGPRIIGPANGAAAWGTVSIGVEMRIADEGPLPHVTLEAGGEMTLVPLADTGSDLRPHRHLRFALETGDMPPGPIAIRPIAFDVEGREIAGEPVTVRVVHPAAEAMTKGEAETPYEGPRPDRFSDDRMAYGRDPAASGGAYFSNAGAIPAVCFPVSVPRDGMYQVMLRVGGSRAGGALPSVGIVVDGEPVPRTNGRLHDTGWHRIAIGVPILLSAGERIITPFFLNDFYVPHRADRNLRIDTVEVVCLDPDPGPASRPATASAPERGLRVVHDPLGHGPAPLRIAFTRPLNGQVLPGLIAVEGKAWWREPEAVRAPVITLLVNDQPTLTQRAGAPLFWLHASTLQPGSNTLQLEAELDDGTIARTPRQTLYWPEDVGPPPPPRRHWRFTVHDPRWSPDVREKLVTRRYPKERVASAFHSNGTSRLELPESIEGRYEIYLEGYGEAFDGPPQVRVSVQTGDAPEDAVEIGTAAMPQWWATQRIDAVTLPAGPKTLLVSFTNDKYEAGKGDRNLLWQSLILVEKAIDEAADADKVPPVARIVYPPPGHAVYGADAVVVEASDNASLASIDLVVDWIDTGQTVAANRLPGRHVLPLLLRDLESGPHRITVRVTDLAGNTTLSAPRVVEVLDAAPSDGTAYDRAVRTLRRFGYGPDDRALAAILPVGAEAWLETSLRGSFDDPGEQAAVAAGLPFFVNRSRYEVPRRALSHAMLTTNPARTRFAFWADNHFSTWVNKIDGHRKWTEHVAFLEAGPTTFDRLLLLSATSPAMLGYLDQDTSFVGRMNENYAREILELHTLGVNGGYDQADVTALARLLTGWTASAEGDGFGGGPEARTWTHRFDPALNDGDAVEVIGLRFDAVETAGRYDRVRLMLETLAAHPSTARFVCRKLAEHYAVIPAPEALVDDLVAVFHETGGDMTAVLLALAGHEAFAVAPDRIATPMDFAIALTRATDHYQPWRVGDFLNRSGYGTFDRATPDGYPEEDAEYAGSNAMIQRWALASEFTWPINRTVPGALRNGNGVPDEQWAQRIVDLIAIRLTGHMLSVTSNEAALTLLRDMPGTRGERVRALGPFITQLPEAGIR